MKIKTKIIILIVSILFILTAGIIESIMMEKVFDEFQERINTLILSDEIYSSQTDELLKWWDKKLNILHLIIPHVHLDEVTRGIGELRGAVIAEDIPNQMAILYKLIATGDSLSVMYKIKLGNIL